jgi:16S rRNA (cytosine967-C5)-methyltransferase
LEEVPFPAREQERSAYLSVRYSMPQWLVNSWIAEHGEDGAEGLCIACNTEAPVSIRANTLKTTPEQLGAQLAKSGYEACKRTAIPEEITLTGATPPTRSKLFQRGHFLIQDAASMLPSHLLEPESGEWVLDLCAAPGGKATHLAQLTRDQAVIVALDLHADRLKLVQENAARLAMRSIAAVCGDGTAAPVRGGFDRVLVDAPCTGLGTLRRHPELKWRVTADMPGRLADVQRELLRAGIRLCKNGGLIVYSVCTISRPETREVARTVLETESVEAEPGPEWLNPWKTGTGQYQTLPTSEGLDGFFLMRLRKAS